MKKISIVIPTYNSWETLKACIDSLMKQTIKPLGIIIVDNASTDGTSQNIKSNFPKIKLVVMGKNTGVTGGRNAGINAISKNSDYIFFFDHDMVAERCMLAELLDVAETSDKIGIVTPKIYYWVDKRRIWAAGTGMNLWSGQVIFRGGKDIGQYDKVAEVQVAPAAMLVKKSVIKKVKRFDDRYFATYEDTDFCFRAKRFGFSIYYAPKAIAYHQLPTDPKSEADRLLARAYWVGKNRVLFMKDFGKNFLIFLFFVPIYIFYYFRLASKYHKLDRGLDFIKGTFSGLVS